MCDDRALSVCEADHGDKFVVVGQFFHVKACLMLETAYRVGRRAVVAGLPKGGNGRGIMKHVLNRIERIIYCFQAAGLGLYHELHVALQLGNQNIA